jgi:urea carboxylase-associated protein 2
VPFPSHDLPGGAATSFVLRRHQRLRLEALDDGACVSLLAYADDRRLERLCVPDTLKCQMQARVRPPMALVSDHGRSLLSMTGSSLDWHDALTGHSLDADLERFGPSSYATDGNGWRRSARTLLLDELAKHGLGERDLHASVNLFAKVVPDAEARLSFVAQPGRGDWAELRADLDVLVVLAGCPHPLDPRAEWAPPAVRLTVSGGPAPGADDPTRTFRPESARALEAAAR